MKRIKLDPDVPAWIDWALIAAIPCLMVGGLMVLHGTVGAAMLNQLTPDNMAVQAAKSSPLDLLVSASESPAYRQIGAILLIVGLVILLGRRLLKVAELRRKKRPTRIRT